MKVLSFLILAFVTHYIEQGIMANGKQTHLGAIACPREYKLGQKVEIQGKVYTCSDRTARWVQKRNGPTFDIFTLESKKDALQWGKKKLEVKLLK